MVVEGDAHSPKEQKARRDLQNDNQCSWLTLFPTKVQKKFNGEKITFSTMRKGWSDIGVWRGDWSLWLYKKKNLKMDLSCKCRRELVEKASGSRVAGQSSYTWHQNHNPQNTRMTAFIMNTSALEKGFLRRWQDRLQSRRIACRVHTWQRTNAHTAWRTPQTERTNKEQSN